MTLFLDQEIGSQSSVLEPDAVEIKGIDYIEFYVGNALQAAHFFRTAFGFTPIAYAGPETGLGGRSAFALQQGDIRLVLTAALTPEDPVSRFVALHGDGVRDIAFSVDDASAAFHAAVRRGATPVLEPTVFASTCGRIVKATAATYGDTVHSFIERQGSVFLPDFEELAPQPVHPLGLLTLDHAAVNVEAGSLERWVDFYRHTLGFHQSHQEDISTEYSAMNSRVVQNRTGTVKFTLVEPAPGKRKSQIDEYLTFNRGAGTQHLAFGCTSILETVRTLRANGISFLPTPSTYYEALESRVGRVNEGVQTLHELGILLDRDPWGYLLQCFTRPLQNRPTFFLEVIERQGARGFGSGNIKALFEALEREQARRGNL